MGRVSGELALKLNLGSGKKRIDGYTNIDINPDTNPDIVADICQLPLDSGVCDEVMAIHTLEHLWLQDVLPALKEWFRVLRPGGRLVLELPCLEKILKNFMRTPPMAQLTLWGVHGDPGTHLKREVWQLHKWTWSLGDLAMALDKAGFDDIKEEQCRYHMPQRDMRLEAVKPDG